MHSGSVASRSTEPRIGNGPSRLPTTAPQGDAARRTNGTSIDAVSLAIIEQLQEDGRRPYAAIGKAVGLSEAAVRQRVQKLLDQGVMQIVAVTDPLTVGFRRQAMVGIRVEGDLDPVAEALTAMAECEYVVMTAGSFDLMVEVVCEDDDHLLEVINKRIRALPGVRSTESFVYLKLKKQTYMWGTR
ncbi:transcriptional regulator [Streptomyces violascens]|uniref:Transcriptional regulator n=1 Tax=Streptomyces violascens TaxID=67381 RepID=A0ABQ3QZ92_9ACTN|nr:Lrp/AsnC family transcriptional regulator [Streptomyces violascens]GGU34599.1 transcriptional regulator [Streptomyces violascens]GHI42594.1 transcriptional regulator [Streptomyces violascens]